MYKEKIQYWVNMSFRTSVCLSEHFVPMLSTPLFVSRMEWQVYIWIPHVQAEVSRLIWCNYEQKKRILFCIPFFTLRLKCHSEHLSVRTLCPNAIYSFVSKQRRLARISMGSLCSGRGFKTILV